MVIGTKTIWVMDGYIKWLGPTYYAMTFEIFDYSEQSRKYHYSTPEDWWYGQSMFYDKPVPPFKG